MAFPLWAIGFTTKIQQPLRKNTIENLGKPQFTAAVSELAELPSGVSAQRFLWRLAGKQKRTSRSAALDSQIDTLWNLMAQLASSAVALTWLQL